jgi:hypothetical protein
MKTLLKVNTTVKFDGQDVDSWELIAVLPSSLMHAVWNPERQGLVCQLNSVKENFVDYPVQQKGQVKWQERRAEQYYRITIYDKKAIQDILDTFVVNYGGEDWQVVYTKPESANESLQENVVQMTPKAEKEVKVEQEADFED